jgi:hypothetical protein
MSAGIPFQPVAMPLQQNPRSITVRAPIALITQVCWLHDDIDEHLVNPLDGPLDARRFDVITDPQSEILVLRRPEPFIVSADSDEDIPADHEPPPPVPNLRSW